MTTASNVSRIDGAHSEPVFDSARANRVLQAQGHLDSGESIFFLRELEQILAEQFDVKYAKLRARELLPVDNQVDPGAESVTYDQFDKFGGAKRVSDFADDLPLVNVKGLQFTQRMQSYGAGFSYSIQELRAAAKVQRPLERMRAMAVRKVLDQQLDIVASLGDSDASIHGLIGSGGQQGISAGDTFTPATKAGGGTTWAVATADEIIADLTAICTQVRVNTKEVEEVKRILLPTLQFELINSKPRSSISDTTVKSFFESTHPSVEIQSWERLNGSGAGGQDRMIGYDPDLMHLRLLMAVEFEMLAPQLRNMAYVINCHMRTGGVICPYPKSVIYGDGI